MKRYFGALSAEVQRAYDCAGSARSKGLDPERRVDIPQAKNMAERVQGLISIAAPQLVGTLLIPRIRELEQEFGFLDWRVALKIAEETASEKFCSFADRREAIEVGVRTGFAYHTLGIVAAPLEGFIGLAIKRRRDGNEYLSAQFAGPVRGAGGTAEAFCVVLVDYLRVKFGYAAFDPDEKEVSRYAVEIRDYHERVTNLQYYPSEDEIKFLVRHVPVEINGDPTEQLDVSNFKDLPRVETNKIRGGVCLVIGEGLAQKAPKLWKRLSQWGAAFGLEWGFLEGFLSLQKSIKAGGEKKAAVGLTANYTFIKDLVAGRPVLTYPLRPGGFRLRYGRARVSGYSAAAVHPATQILLDEYIAVGTQLKVERPGKACSLTLCDALEGPIVRLRDGSVMHIRTSQQARSKAKEVEKLLFLGDIMFNYGDFAENNHILVPAGYCEEWWLGEVAQALGCSRREVEQRLSSIVSAEDAALVCAWWSSRKPGFALAEKLSRILKVPLHPAHLLYWSILSPEELAALGRWMCSGAQQDDGRRVLSKGVEKALLEKIGAPHIVSAEHVVIPPDVARSMELALGLDARTPAEVLETLVAASLARKPSLETLNSLSSITLRDKAGTFIGCRMGRPEKGKMRKLTGSPHVLFPVGREGDQMRSFHAALEKGHVSADFALYECPTCVQPTVYAMCHRCGTEAEKRYYCRDCDKVLSVQTCAAHGKIPGYRFQQVKLKEYFEHALSLFKEPSHPDLIKGVRGTSNKDHIPEHLLKGILRAKHEICVNKDGTTRYDITELPITHFKPLEIGTPVEKLITLGYTHDIEGLPLERDDQVLELFPQDVIIPSNVQSFDEAADTVLLRIAAFVDELLEKLYGLPAYYGVAKSSDLVGHLVIGLAPHISAGTIGRIVGFSSAQGCYAHPLWHAALRRDCDGDECSVILLLDALLNFSRQYLPDRRGGRTMDSPLVLTVQLNPSEVDDMAHGLDVVWEYPVGFYQAALTFVHPKDFPVEQLGRRLGTPGEYEGIGFTHPTTDINAGVLCSAYKTLPTMQEKLLGQMSLAERISAVDVSDVARLVIEKHFIKDIKGNLRKFFEQEVRCVRCNEKYRRPPLHGRCVKPSCGGNLIFTIAEGSVVKYVEPSISLAVKYDLPPFLKETLELTRTAIESAFGKEKETQMGLGKWFAPEAQSRTT